MKKHYLFLVLILTSCATFPLNPSKKTSHVVGNRWIDMNEILDFANYSIITDITIKHTDVINFLGEPIYFEKFNIDGKPNTLLWYLYKSKFYPIIEEKYNAVVGENTLQSNQIKPEKIANYNQWDSTEKWLLIVINDEYHEIIFTTLDNPYEPKYKRDMIFESKRFDKILLENIDSETAKAILENN